MIVYLSKHFVQRWKRRVSGGAPVLQDEVNGILRQSIRIRNQIQLYKVRKRRYVPHRVLAEYWYHPMGIIIKVDERRKVAVTVITAYRHGNGNGNGGAASCRAGE
jgi:hypothetical protein